MKCEKCGCEKDEATTSFGAKIHLCVNCHSFKCPTPLFYIFKRPVAETLWLLHFGEWANGKKRVHPFFSTTMEAAEEESSKISKTYEYRIVAIPLPE